MTLEVFAPSSSAIRFPRMVALHICSAIDSGSLMPASHHPDLFTRFAFPSSKRNLMMFIIFWFFMFFLSIFIFVFLSFFILFIFILFFYDHCGDLLLVPRRHCEKQAA